MFGSRVRLCSAAVRAVSGSNVFAEFSQLATKVGAVNLGQGFPSFPAAPFLGECLAEASTTPTHYQYTRPAGFPPLCETLANLYSPFLNRKIDPMNEIAVFCGGQEAAFCILMALVDKHQEVVIVEPSFDCYGKSAAMLGLKVRTVRLKESQPGSGHQCASNWRIDYDALKAALNQNTKLLIINTPNSPLGKTMTVDEINELADFLDAYPDVIVVSDEVYEFMTYDGIAHNRISSIPKMFNKTISLHSAGKTFSCTGWRIGYTIAPPHLTQPIAKAMSVISFCAPTILQAAVNFAFQRSMKSDYFNTLASTLGRKRSMLVDGLRAAKFEAGNAQGGYFVWARPPPLRSLQGKSDHDMCKYLVENARVCGIPGSTFFIDRPQTGAVRFAFCKTDSEIVMATAALANFVEAQANK
eukprot:c10011_g1_i1.p1 GENE.c10011_g1_i1~~c10011_g1_i1.p1  ORF type:complete len:425 (+),score=96.04 c10011_g1_i1:38-1276(+)